MPEYASNANAFARGLRSEYDAIYDVIEKTVPPEIDQLFEKGDGDGAFEDYHTFREAGIFKRWDPNKGDKRTVQPFSDLSKRLYTKDWENGVSWRINDEKDDRSSKKMVNRARSAAEDAALIDDRVAAVLMTGTADEITLKSDDIPTCIDGQVYYSTSHEEHANGNILAGGDVDTTAKIKRDWFKVLRRFTEMKFPRNRQPYFPSALVHRASYIIFVSPENYELFAETFELQDRAVIIQNAAADENVAAASVQNIVKSKYGQRVTIVPYQRISGNDWFVFMMLPGKGRKPFLRDEVQGMNEVFYDEDNSDRSRDHKTRQLGWDFRRRYGYLNWITSIKVDN